MNYSNYALQPRIGGQAAWGAAAARLPGGPGTSTYHVYSPRVGSDFLSFKLRGTGPHGLERQRWYDSDQNASPAVRPDGYAAADCGQETWPCRIMADLRPGFGDKARDVVELILVAVYASAALAEMAMALTPALP